MSDSRLRIEIFTALTLKAPDPSGDFDTRFLGPAMDRLFGACPPLGYAELLHRDALPDNIAVHAFFISRRALAGAGEGRAAGLYPPPTTLRPCAT